MLLPASCSTPSLSPLPLQNEEEEYRRLLVRRFQIKAKCTDAATAKIYIDAIIEERERERGFVESNRRARALNPPDGDGGLIRRGGEVEDAVDHYMMDLKWEKREGSAGRLGSRGGPSRIRPF